MEESESTIILGFVSSCLSIVGVLFTMAIYWLAPSTRKNFFFFLAFHLAISDLGVAATGLTLVSGNNLSTNLCTGLATVRGFAIESSGILNLLIALFLYKAVQTDNSLHSFSFHKVPLLLVTYSFSLFACIGPLLSGAYGPSDIYCWIADVDINYTTEFWLIAEAYITLPITILWIILLYFWTIRLLRRTVSADQKSDINKLAIVPLVFVVCNGIALVDIWLDDSVGAVAWIKPVHTCLRQMQGLFHALIYGFGIIKGEIIGKWNERLNRKLLHEEYQLNTLDNSKLNSSKSMGSINV